MKIKKNLFSLLGLYFITYIIFAFITAQINFVNWEIEFRALCGVLFFIELIVVIFNFSLD